MGLPIAHSLAQRAEDDDAISVVGKYELSHSRSLCKHGQTFPITNRSLTINVVQNPFLPTIHTVRKPGTEADKARHLPCSRTQEHILFHFRHRQRRLLAWAAALRGIKTKQKEKVVPSPSPTFAQDHRPLGAAPMRKGFQTGVCAGWLPGGGSRPLAHLIREPLCQPTTKPFGPYACSKGKAGDGVRARAPAPTGNQGRKSTRQLLDALPRGRELHGNRQGAAVACHASATLEKKATPPYRRSYGNNGGYIRSPSPSDEVNAPPPPASTRR